jgi:peptidyl-prolyl cis-trans isomerase A (cyclophilin A)
MGGSPDTRTTQVFINFRDNTNLDAMGFAAFGQVTTGMDVVDKIHTGYGEGAPRGQGPDQGRIQAEGNAYLVKSFPRLDYIKSATIGK